LFGNCDGNPTNGCETPLNTLTDCGACGTICDLPATNENCAGGTCVPGTCPAGFADCDGNPTNGCEAQLDTVLNCGACGHQCELFKANEACVSGACAIAGCCGYDSTPGSPCAGNLPADTFTDCDGIAANGCETVRNATCSAALADTDHDGFLDTEERPIAMGGGVDSNNDSIADLDIFALGASPTVPDIFLEVDYMDTPQTTPNVNAITDIVQAFAARGINLHVDLGTAAPLTSYDLGEGNAVPYADTLGFADFRPGLASSGLTFKDFDDIKLNHFKSSQRRAVFHYAVYGYGLSNGNNFVQTTLASDIAAGATEVPVVDATFVTRLPRSGYNPPAEVDGDRFTYTGWTLTPSPRLTGVSGIDSAHTAGVSPGVRVSAVTAVSGLSEFFGNDLMVTMWGYSPTGPSRAFEGGTVMHELGHNLGLDHGGGDPVNYKSNYLSVMNYRFQTGVVQFAPGTCTVAVSRLDYSGAKLPKLTETALPEVLGIGDGSDDTLYNCPSGLLGCARGNMPIDWNCDLDNGTAGDVCGVAGLPACNINRPDDSGLPIYTPLTGYNDWQMLRMDFRDSGNGYLDGSTAAWLTTPELDAIAFRADIPVVLVPIDIRPGAPKNNINLRGNPVVPVAILANPKFSPVTALLASSVTFGHRGDEVPALGCLRSDVDGDGDSDLLCQFRVRDAGFTKTDTFGNLRALTIAGDAVGGFDHVTPVP
jgi:hypothetical protein